MESENVQIAARNILRTLLQRAREEEKNTPAPPMTVLELAIENQARQVKEWERTVMENIVRCINDEYNDDDISTLDYIEFTIRKSSIDGGTWSTCMKNRRPTAIMTMAKNNVLAHMKKNGWTFTLDSDGSDMYPNMEYTFCLDKSTKSDSEESSEEAETV
jgi:hypothetical protein